MQNKGDYLDEKVGSILTDLGYTKTRHQDKYVIQLQGGITSRRIYSPSGTRKCTVVAWPLSSTTVLRVGSAVRFHLGRGIPESDISRSQELQHGVAAREHQISFTSECWE